MGLMTMSDVKTAARSDEPRENNGRSAVLLGSGQFNLHCSVNCFAFYLLQLYSSGSLSQLSSTSFPGIAASRPTTCTTTAGEHIGAFSN